MHLLIPFAAPLSAAGLAAAATLQLPQLRRLLRSWCEASRDAGDEWNLSPPHERAMARAFGWHGASGTLPFAARAAQADGVAVGDLAWGLLTPVHWHLGTDQVSLLDPAQLLLDAATSRALFDAVAPLFDSLGFALHWAAPLRWYAAHDSLAGLATASLDRVVGRNVDAWLGAAQALRRLQSEVQMLLYTHPANDAREARGLLPVNSFWLSGCGVAQPVRRPEPVVDDRLRAPALADDWAAWVKAWETLDSGPLAALDSGPAAASDSTGRQLTLCGERSAACFEPAQRGALQRLQGWLRGGAATPLTLLESL